MKYGNRRTNYSGYSFSSKLETAVFQILKLREAAGEIRDIVTQPNIFITEAAIRMIPDFKAFDIKAGCDWYFEAKGVETDVWRLKLKLYRVYGPAPLTIYKGSWKSPSEHETVHPRGL